MDGCENHPGRADAALRPAALQKGLLQDVPRLTRCKSLDRNHVRTCSLKYGHEAAIHEDAVHQHCARTALSFSAPFFCSGQLELLPKDIEQSFHRVSAHRFPLAIDRE